MEKFVVKSLSQADSCFILSLAFSFGWKWFDDPQNPKPSGQTVKNTDATYFYFGFKGEGLISRRNTVNKSVTPSQVLNSRNQLPQIMNSLKENTVLHVGADALEYDDKGRVVCGCRKYSKEMVAEVIRIASEVEKINDSITFHANGDVTFGDRLVSNYILQAVSEKLG